MRAVHLALLVRRGQPGAPSVLTTPRWGFYDVLFKGKTFELPRPFGNWVIDNVQFKINTAEGHGMTAIEAALELAHELKERHLSTDDIASIKVRTTEAAMTIINKQGPLHNAADRDHCLRYMVAVVLLKGSQIETKDYQDDGEWAKDPRVEELRAKTTMMEDPQMTRDYNDQEIHSVSNGLTITLKDGTALNEVVVNLAQGHARRADTFDLLRVKTKKNMTLRLSEERVDKILAVTQSEEFFGMPVDKFIDLLAL